MHQTRRCHLTFAVAIVTAVASVVLTGCGIGTLAPATSAPTEVSSGLGGKAMGGEIPIAGGTASIWVTNNSGVAQAGGWYSGSVTAHQSVITAADGTFTFDGTACASANSWDQVYVTVVGGNAGGGNNKSIVLMAAVGPCSTLGSVSYVVVNEVTTVAAAYALAGFTVTDGTNVFVTASANNYATSSTATGATYHPVGLQHAFLNAAHLANYANGQPLTTFNTTNSSNSTSASVAVTPYILINTVASILQNCVNSAGSIPPLVFPASSTATSSAGAATTTSFPNASDTFTGSLAVNVNGGGITTVGPYTGISASTLVADINTALASQNVTATLNTSTSITLTGAAGAGNTLVVGSTSSYYPGSTDMYINTATPTETTCGTVLQYALPMGSSTVPTNTLQAALNIARNPYMNGNASTFVGLITGIGAPAFTPYFAATGVKDLSATIVYPKGSFSTQVPAVNGGVATYSIALTYPYPSTMTANDAFIVANPVANSTNGYEPTSLIGFSSDGSTVFNRVYCATSATSTTVPSYNQSTCAEPFGIIKGLAADVNGNIWGALAGSTATSSSTTPAATLYAYVTQFSSVDGSANGPASTANFPSAYYSTPFPFSIATDQLGNAWVGISLAGGNTVGSFKYNLFEYQPANLSSSTPYTGAGLYTGATFGIAVDALQNVWAAMYTATASATNYVGILANQQDAVSYATALSTAGALAQTPSYTYAALTTAPTSGATTAAITGQSAYDVAIGTDAVAYVASGTGTAGTTIGLTPVTPTYGVNTNSPSYNTETALSAGTIITGSSTVSSTVNKAFANPRFMKTDGIGSIWVADTTTGGALVRVTEAGSVLGYNFCYATTIGAISATCSVSSTYSSSNPRNVAIDSTGTVWVTNTTQGQVVQVLGVAAPVFPLDAAGKPGVMP